jgi:hypothetical protein
MRGRKNPPPLWAGLFLNVIPNWIGDPEEKLVDFSLYKIALKY